LRRVALKALMEIERGGNSSAVLERLLRKVKKRNTPFITELVMGVLRWRNRLDYAISYFSNKRLNRIEPEVLNALRMGIYEIEKMNTPEYAAVKETVNLVRGSWRRAFVNGILRNFIREQVRYPTKDEPLMFLTYTLSTPEWKALRWLEDFGIEKSEKLALYYNSTPAIYLRVNRKKTSTESLIRLLKREGIVVDKCKNLPFCLRVLKGNPRFTSALKNGLFYVQDIASQIAGFIASEIGNTVWDCCAAPGGKSSHLAEIGFKVFSSDISLPRLRLAISNFRRLGLEIHSFVADALRPSVRRKFPLILVDSPCSSMGIIHRAPEVKWRIVPEKLKELSVLQKRILKSVLRYGEKVLYVVCTQEPEETVNVLSDFNIEELPLPGDIKKIPFLEKEKILYTDPTEIYSDGMSYALITK